MSSWAKLSGILPSLPVAWGCFVPARLSFACHPDIKIAFLQLFWQGFLKNCCLKTQDGQSSSSLSFFPVALSCVTIFFCFLNKYSLSPTAACFYGWLSVTQRCLQKIWVEYNCTGHGLILGKNSEVPEYRSEKRLNCWVLQRWAFLCRAGYGKHGRTWNGEGRVGNGVRERAIQSLKFLWVYEMVRWEINSCSGHPSAFITWLCISSPESFQGHLYHLVKYFFIFSKKNNLCIQKGKKCLTAITKVCGRNKLITALFLKRGVKFLRSYVGC